MYNNGVCVFDEYTDIYKVEVTNEYFHMAIFMVLRISRVIIFYRGMRLFVDSPRFWDSMFIWLYIRYIRG